MRKVQPGTAPGSLTAPTQRVDGVEIDVICYSPDEVREMRVESIKDAFREIEESNVTWINVTGLYDLQLIHDLGHHFDLHPLALDDVGNVGQRQITRSCSSNRNGSIPRRH